MPTTDDLVAAARINRHGQEYPTPQQLIENLPVVLRGLCDYVLTGEATAYDKVHRNLYRQVQQGG